MVLQMNSICYIVMKQLPSIHWMLCMFIVTIKVSGDDGGRDVYGCGGE